LSIQFSRRKFVGRGIATTTAAIGGGVLSGAARAGSRDERARFGGTIESATRDGARVLVDGLGTVDVLLAPGATVVHAIGGDNSGDLSAFRVGERVALIGQLSDGVFTATSVEPVYRRLTAVVIEDMGEIIRTTSGPIRVPCPREALPQLERGKTFVAVVSSCPGEDPLLQAWDLG
jgi:hypothetical protein